MNITFTSAFKQLVLGISILSILLLGTCFYIAARPDNTYLYSWFSTVSSPDFLIFLRENILSEMRELPAIIWNSLPDGLWMAALMLTILWIWDFRLHKASLLWCTVTILMGIVIEACQLIQLVPGHFDIHDLWMILAGGLLPLTFTQILNQIWKKN